MLFDSILSRVPFWIPFYFIYGILLGIPICLYRVFHNRIL